MTTEMPEDIISFLLGQGSLDGVWFGDKHPTGEAYWWRIPLRKYVDKVEELQAALNHLRTVADSQHRNLDDIYNKNTELQARVKAYEAELNRLNMIAGISTCTFTKSAYPSALAKSPVEQENAHLRTRPEAAESFEQQLTIRLANGGIKLPVNGWVIRDEQHQAAEQMSVVLLAVKEKLRTIELIGGMGVLPFMEMIDNSLAAYQKAKGE